jgi:hypothetical protein
MTVPSCSSANCTSQDCFAAISRCRFSTDPADGRLRTLPRWRATSAPILSTVAW